MLGESLPDVLHGRAGLRRRDWERGPLRERLRRVRVARDNVEERFLALNVPVERPFRDAERGGDVGHLRPGIALLDEDLRRDIDQPFQAVFRNAPCHGVSYT